MSKLTVAVADDGVATMTLTDPDRRNAMGYEMAAEMIAAAGDLAGDPDVRALVVTGEGKGFCAGADLPQLFGRPDRPVAELRAELQGYYRAFLAIRDLSFPTIAAVNGAAVGAGLNLAMACDVRIAGTHATMGATFAKIGLHPGGGCTWFLVKAMGPSRALTTLLLGDLLDAERCVELGLAEGPEEDCVGVATDLAHRFAQVDPQLARHIKRSVALAVETDDLGAVLEYESWAQAASAQSDELRRWVAKFS
ncbi:enoyl-CoA hydratase [Euzebya sp.]|uniref:enoyl-CoA hydratase n=1 Tax=Euzebya sp. TaxID=1971409 RepID=UPI003511A4C9